MKLFIHIIIGVSIFSTTLLAVEPLHGTAKGNSSRTTPHNQDIQDRFSKFFDELSNIDDVQELQKIFDTLLKEIPSSPARINLAFLRLTELTHATDKNVKEFKDVAALITSARANILRDYRNRKELPILRTMREVLAYVKQGQELKPHSPGKSEFAINVDGSTGERGSDGVAGRDGSFSGSDGTNGTAAGNGSNATNAGNINLNLSETEDGKIRASGSTNTLPIRTSIRLSARGGSGGNGGHGGRGGDGQTGSRGSDATEHSSGTNGGPGGDGGNGAKGGDGGNAGKGGQIDVNTTFDDSHLLSLIDQIDVAAGLAGRRGSGGRAGRGGSGGSGGSSHSWTTYTTETRTVSRSRTNSDGSTDYYTDTESYQVPHHHSNPGGSNGSSGTTGSSGLDGSDGKEARPGDFRFNIDFGNGKKITYKQIYNLTLQGYQIEDENKDGIFEPGERVFIKGIKIRNSGGMPTPPLTKSLIRLKLEGDSGHSPVDSSLILPQSLDVNEPFHFDSDLSFIVADIDGPSVNKPLKSTLTVKPIANLEPTDRGFSHFNNPSDLARQFPLQIKVSAPPALAQGESGFVFLEVTNISKKAIAPGTETDRLVSLLLKEESGQDRPMHFTDASGKPVSLRDGVSHAIEKLAPGETKKIQGRVTVPHEFTPQSAYTFNTFLNLERQNEEKQVRPVQQEVHRLSVASKYETNPDADFVIIINNETRPEELLAWTRLLEDELGFKVTTWNTAYYGNFDIDAEEIQDPRWHLLSDFKGKTIVLLNNQSKSYSGKWATAWDNLSKKGFQKATGLKESNFLILGNMDSSTARKEFEEVLLKARPETGSRVYNSPGALIDSLKILHTERMDQTNRAVIKNDFHRVKVVDKFYWGTPNEENLKQRAEKLGRDLKSLWPHRKYVVSHHFKGDELKKGGTFRSSEVYLGDIDVQRIPDRGDKVVSALSVSDEELHKPETIRSAPVMSALMNSLSTKDKIKALDRLMKVLNGSPNEEQVSAVRFLGESLINDILKEYIDTLKGGMWRGRPTPRTIQELRKWTPANQPKAGSYSEHMMVGIYARAVLAGKYAYLSLPFLGGTAKQASKSAQADLEAWSRNLYPKKEDRRRFETEVSKKMAAIEKEAKTSFWNFNSTNQNLIEKIVNIHEKDSVDSTQVLSGDLVTTKARLDELHQQDRARRDQWLELLLENQAARKTLKSSKE